MMGKLWANWRQRSLRERRLMLVLLSTVMAAGLWLMVWQPLQQAIANQQQRQQQLRLQWRQLQQISPQPAVNGDLRQLLEKTIAEQGLTLRGTTEQQGQIRVELAVANAEDVLRWLDQVESRGGIRVMELQLQSSLPPDGRVRAGTLLLERQ
ncbi:MULTISPECIES: type II secretion system protein GspM [unclassified Serratia (in: enterobacteria)]|uniref:type II secretion system protein GspM n=1 Tax=unclassified Serratia (in: enterobacteria) TaxID=2647522 RepID=UPI0004695A5B|nr:MULTISPECIES: type II secretion system protein GspM [unclassified Serratia (in: enterobacteria)]